VSIPCSNCRAVTQPLLTTRDTNQQLSTATFTYVRCPACGLVSIADVPADLGHYYRSHYYAIPDSRLALAQRAELQRHKIDVVKSYKSSGTLLEIGPAFGDFIYLAQEAEFTTEAIEMDSACCTFLRSTLGINAIESNDPVISLTECSTYDVIALWQVIEHVPDPWELLRAMTDHLKPGGILVMSAPNPKSLQFALFKSQWAHLDAPRHLNLIPVDVLIERGSALGLKPIFVTTNDGEGIKANVYGWKKSIMNRLGIYVRQETPEVAASTIELQPSESFRYILSRAIIRSVVGMVMGLAAPLERTGFRGASYTLILQK
jgi:SAM-dependent methyltransferase